MSQNSRQYSETVKIQIAHTFGGNLIELISEIKIV